ncbi:MAG: thioesterase family protein [Deltaproteobacteria bacterium]|nr:thioesterase family protein [Deltaproteobacteria bacterium]
MYVWLRAARALARSRRAPSLGMLDDSVLRLRVGLGDLDVNFHLNNGRYLTLMDVGRLDLLGRTGMLRLLYRNKWWPRLASATIRYRRSLEAFEAFELRTRARYWDAKWLYLESLFERQGEVCAQGLVKWVFKEADGRTVAPATVSRALGGPDEPPPSPPGLDAWQTWEGLTLREMSRASARED